MQVWARIYKSGLIFASLGSSVQACVYIRGLGVYLQVRAFICRSGLVFGGIIVCLQFAPEFRLAHELGISDKCHKFPKPYMIICLLCVLLRS